MRFLPPAKKRGTRLRQTSMAIDKRVLQRSIETSFAVGD